MKLSQLFGGEKHIEENNHTTQPQSARTADVNRQIRSLVPGQTIRGEVVTRNGSEIQIRLSEDMVLNARVDQSINLEPGQNVTFEVRSNRGSLSLSPLFTNVAADVNVMKALDMAGLPVNETSVAMTEQLMKAGLSVNRNMLHQVYREVNSFPGAEVSDVVNLHRLGMPVNEANMQQMASYRNLSHQLIDGMNTVLETLPRAIGDMLFKGDFQGAAELYRVFVPMMTEGAETLQPGASAEGAMAAPAGTTETPEGTMSAPLGSAETQASPAGVSAENVTKQIFLAAEAEMAGLPEEGTGPSDMKNMEEGRALQASGPGDAVAGMPGEEQSRMSSGENDIQKAIQEFVRAADQMQFSTHETELFAARLKSIGTGELPAGQLFQMASELLQAAEDRPESRHILQSLLGGKEFGRLLAGQMKEQWTIRPEEVAKPEQVEELYNRLNRQLKTLTDALGARGQENSAAFKAATTLSQNLDFMNQMNQVYTYVQLPLQLQHADAHGELYVYTNKRSLAQNNGQISALLHLDMENLGPLDVYVTLQETKVNTKFYVADESVLDFLELHMDLLTERLQKRGYDCQCTLSARDAESGGELNSGLAPILRQDGGMLLSQYAFDVRT